MQEIREGEKEASKSRGVRGARLPLPLHSLDSSASPKPLLHLSPLASSLLAPLFFFYLNDLSHTPQHGRFSHFKSIANPYNPPPLLLESLDSLSFLLLFTMELDLYDFRFLAVGLRKINGGKSPKFANKFRKVWVGFARSQSLGFSPRQSGCGALFGYCR